MIKSKAIKSVLLCATVCVASYILFTGRFDSMAHSQKQQPEQLDDRQQLVDVLRREGLRGAAKLKRHYVTDFNPHFDMALYDIERLTKHSAAVIAGLGGPSVGSYLTADGRGIETDYQVIVEESLKGDFIKGSTIIVSLEGGLVRFEDGTSAELRTPTFEHIKSGGRYILFLTEVEAVPGKYTLTAGPQGLVSLLEDGSVKSHGRPTDPVAVQARENNKARFMKSAREQAKKWPNKGKCCR
jgi:hypothetical protein